MNDAIGGRGAGAQAVDIVERAAMNGDAGGGEHGRARVGTREAGDGVPRGA